MLSDQIGTAVVTYNCPKCKRKSKRNFPYVRGDKGNVVLASAGWCSDRYCEARHRFDYRISDKGDRLQIQGLAFTCNGNELKKRVQVLAWG
jgi:hypothetical protein